MLGLMLLIGAAAAAPAPVHAAPPVAVTAPVRRDIRCFLLYAAAVGGDESKSDAQTKSAGTLGIMFFYGKLKSEAPTLNLFPAMQQEATAMESDPKLKESGAACDAEFRNAGSELSDLGKRLEELAPHPAPTS